MPPTHGRRSVQDSPAASPAFQAVRVRASLRRGVDPNLPVFVGDSRRIIARAIDDTAHAPLDRAVVSLGHRFLGTPVRHAPTRSALQERLVLDLTAVDQLGFVEQLLALVNSRKVRTRTEAVDRFSDHVRRLRYGGFVAPCRRLRQPILWALAAERNGYLVDLSRFLPGAQQRRLPLQALQRPAGATVRDDAGSGHCHLPAGSPTDVAVHTLPLAALEGVLPSLRSGDVFLVVSRSSQQHASRIGLVDIANGRTGALMAQPGRGVQRWNDLIDLVRASPDSVGVTFLRPVPNSDGRADR